MNAENMPKKIYYLEDKTKFWEITVTDTCTQIRAGRKSFKGRVYAVKHHTSNGKAKQFALEQVNCKIMQGYSCPSERTPQNDHDEMHNGKLTELANSHPLKRSWRKPPKKRDSVRKLCRQSTLTLTETLDGSTPSLLNQQPSEEESIRTERQKWRKPPKKQSTIRRMAKGASLRRSSSLRKTLFETNMAV